MSDRLRILVVDDDEIDRMAVRRALKDAGVDADVVETGAGEHGRQILCAEPFDCALVDNLLPDIDGLRLLRALAADGVTTPVIMMTGQGNEQLAVDLMKAGAADYLSKSRVSLDHLARSVRNAVRVHRAELAAARAAEELHEQTRVAQALHRIGSRLAEERDLQRLVQLVTDEATQLAGAEFGAFFYNVLNDRGESYILYTLSGVPREHFEKFAMPRNTAIFAPTFSGEGIVRLDDVTQDPRYGKNDTYAGMPPRHLPVRSYLAVPVISRSGEVIGGLFFGHQVVGVFNERDERLIAGIASQAAVAIDNARLYEALRRGEEQYRFMAESIPQMVFTATADGTTDHFNRRWTAYTGRTLAESIRDGWHGVLHPDDLQRCVARWSHAVATGELYEIEYRLRRRDGAYRWHLGRAESMRDAGGNVIKWFGTCTDIHDRKIAESDLHEQRERLEAALSASGTGTFRWDIRSGRLEFDPSLTRLFGLGPDQTLLTLQTAVRIIHPDDRAAFIEQINRCVNTGVDFDMEYRVVMPDGEIRWLDDKGKTFNDPADGRPLYMTGACVDITSRKRIDQALRRSEFRFRQLADAMPQIVWTADADGNVEYFNRRWTDYTGLGVDRSLGENWTAVLHPDDLEPSTKLWRHAVRTGETFQNEHRFRHKDGTYRWQLARGVPVRDEDGRVTRWFGTCTDVDDYKRAEQAIKESRDALEAANNAKDQFLAVLSHELRTPLMPVLMTVQALQDDRSPTPAALADALDVIRRNVELEARLIDDLLDLTRISKGKLQLNVDTVDLHAVIRSAMDICSVDVMGKRLGTTLDLTATRHHVRGDPARLQQVFWNLIKNAIKFTPAGGHVTVHTWDDPSGAVNARVTDTGIGIEPAALSRIFDAFEQADQSVTRQFGGLGLGLAISKALVDLHGGRLSASSPGVGRGSTFTLEMRPSSAAATAPAHPGDGDAAPAAVAAGLEQKPADIRILLVDDHHDTNRAMARLLQRLGYDVQTADSVRSALEAAGERKFDLLISDIGLPDGSGLELMRELLQRHPIKGIALSGFGMEEDVKKSKEAGFYEHLTKPINFKRLETAIRDLTTAT
jgi:PAS domain S-box-containing protein